MSVDTGFDEVQFDPKIDYGFEGGPRYKTTIIETDSGSEQRISHWVTGRHEWTTSSGIKNRIDRDLILAFFHARQGRARGFRWKDWNDYKAVLQPCIPILGNTWQLAKSYNSGGKTLVRAITKPVAGTIVMQNSLGGTLSGMAVDTTTGIVTVNDGASYTSLWASFQFDVPVRFDIDYLPFNRGGFEINTAQIKIIEIRI